MSQELTEAEAQALNNSSPAAQNAQVGTKIKAAIEGDLPAGSIGATELASSAVTTAKIAVNAVNLAKISIGLSVGIAAEDALTTDRDTMNAGGLATAMALANSLKTVTNAHAADAAEHATAIDNVNYPVATANATTLITLLALAGALLTAYDVHDDDAELGGGWAYHIAQETGDHTPTSVVTPTDLNEAITRLNDLKAKYNAHDADATTHTTGSTHQEATSNAALSASIEVAQADTLSGDTVVWGILNSGTGTVTGVTAVAGAAKITFTFSAEPQDDAIITYAVFREAT